MNNLSTRLLDAFLALVETRHFGLAAQRCHITPSALSQMISRLESQLQVRLFDRDTRNVSLTPEGETFAQGVARITHELQSTLKMVHDRQHKKTGRVRLAAPPSLAADWLPQRMARFRQQYPGVTLSLSDVVSDRCLEMLRQGQADIGINAQPGNPLEFDSCQLFREPMYVLCRTDHPLAQRKRVHVRELRHQPFIHTTRDGSVWQHAQPLVLEAGVVDTGLEVTQLATLSGLVAHGFGISLVPQFALALCNRSDVVAIPLADRKVARPMYLVRLRQQSLSVAAQAFYDLLREG